MIELFTRTEVSNRAMTRPGYLDNNQAKMRKQLGRVVEHLRNRNWYVYNTHILVKLLGSIAVERELDLFEYHRRVSSIALDLAKTLGISSSLHKAVGKDSYMLGDRYTEIYVAINEHVDLLTVEDNWKDLQPVKFLRHDVTSLDFTPLDGRRDEGYGKAVIQIDVVKLALQYRSWYLDQKDKGVEDIPTLGSFVASYPTANAMYTFHDHCIWNRFRAIYNGETPDDKSTVLPFLVPSSKDMVDKYLKYCVNQIERKSMTFDMMQKQVELITAKDAFELNRLPTFFISRQVEWAIFISRMRTIIFLVKTNEEWEHKAKNRKDTGILKTYLKSIRSANIFGNTLSLLDVRAIKRDIVTEIKPYI